MKLTLKKLGILSILIALMAFTMNAKKENPKVIALLNKASWCPVCKSNGPRVEKDVMPMLMKDANVKLVVNDLSDNETIEKSKPMLMKEHIADFAQNHKNTGMLYFINSTNHQLIDKVSLAKSNEKIMMVYKEALAKIKK